MPLPATTLAPKPRSPFKARGASKSVPARRGDLALIETVSVAVYLKGGATQKTAYFFQKVTSTTRDGLIKAAVDARGSTSSGRPAKSWILPAEAVDVDALLAEVATTDLAWKGFASIEEAQVFARRFKRDVGYE